MSSFFAEDHTPLSSCFSHVPSTRTTPWIDDPPSSSIVQRCGGDDLYAVNGTTTAPGISPVGRDVGQEIDVLLTHRVARHLDVFGGWSHFFTGSAVRGPGITGSDIDFAYVGASFVF